MQRDVEIAPLTTYRLGGPAAYFLEAKNIGDIERASRFVQDSNVPVLVVGKGSNLLVSDRGFDGLVITLAGEFAEIEIEGTTVKAGAAVSLPVLARRTAAAALTGLEWAVGVPGSVGGAVRMNAGGHGSQTSESLRRVDFVDLRTALEGDGGLDWLELGYRTSKVQPHQVVTVATFELEHGDKEKSEGEISSIVKWRRENQPGGRNAGSVFTNPKDDSAGRLIEAAGMKGAELGSATVSPKHANFIQSADAGTAADVLSLMKKVRQAVMENTGVMLRPEVRLVGFTDEELEGLR